MLGGISNVGYQTVAHLVSESSILGWKGATDAQVGYCNGDSSLVSEASLTTITLGETYTLTIDVGSRYDLPSSGFQFGLYNGNPASGGTVLGMSPISNPLDDNVMRAYNYSYTVNAGNPNIGGSLYIILTNESGSFQTNFDNIRLESSAVPEASTCAMFGLGLLPLFRRRRSRG